MEIKTFIIPTDLPLCIPRGYANGYVAIPKGHPWYGKHYTDIDADVHGGLTFSGFVDKEFYEDCIDEDLSGYWIIGFDTCHHGDGSHLTKEYVLNEVNKLKKQAQEAYK